MASKRFSQPSWCTVKQLFKDQSNIKYIIPVYQRNYVWEVKNQVKKLLDDFYELVGKDDDYTHFLGIIIDYNAGKKDRIERYYVIDGQQRLTTLFLLIAAIRQRAIEENNNVQINELDYWMNINYNSQEGNKNFKLEPLMGDREIFNKLLLGEYDSLSDSEKSGKLAQAYIYILNFFKNTLSKIDVVDLIDTLDKFLLVEIPLDRDDNAQQIFETINARGSKLLSTDLIRNYVLMCADDDKMDSVFTKCWQPFESKFIDSKEMESFFYYFLMSQKRESIKSSDVYDEFRSWLDENKTARGVEEAINYASKYADMYNLLYKEPIYNFKNERLWKSLKDFRNIKSDMPAPMMMEIMHLYKTGKITEEQLNGVIDVVTSFILRRAIVGLDTSGITRFFRGVLNTILTLVDEDYSNIVDVVRFCLVDENVNKGSRMPSNDDIRKELETRNVYDLSLALHCFFDKYENEKMTNPVETMNYQIEHIMPQDGKKWCEVLNISEEEYVSYVNRLGNLTLTTKHDNPAMSNNLFEYKKIILKDTAGFRLNKDVYSEPEWTIKQIELRNKLLIEDLIRLYPYALSENNAMYSDSLVKSRNLPRMDKLIEWGLVSIGDELYLKRYKDTSKATLRSENEVVYNGEILKLSQWVSKLYGFNVGINIYREICPISSEDSLDVLRKEYIKEHKEIDSKNGNNLYRNAISAKIKEVLLEKEKEGLLFVLPSGNRHIRFAGIQTRNKVGLNGSGEWDKIEDLVAYEISNETNGHVDLVIYIGPGNDQDLRLKWHNFAKNSPALGGRYKELKKKWDPMNRPFVLVSSLDRFENQDDYEKALFEAIENMFNTTFIEIENTFEVAPENLDDEIFKYVEEQNSSSTKTGNIIIPCNKRYYDIDGALEILGVIDYTQTINVKAGAKAYIYSSSPFESALIYECEIIASNKLVSTINDDSFARQKEAYDSNKKRYMEVKLVRKLDYKKLSFGDLKDHGLTGNLQSQCYVTEELQKFIDDMTK